MDEIVKTIAWSAPLSAILATAALWLGRNLLLERLKGSIAFEYNRALESHKAEIKTNSDAAIESLKAHMQDRSHLLKAKFDMEFQGYQKLWAALAALVDASARLARLYSRTENSQSKSEKFSHAENADHAYFLASSVCQELQPFIAEGIYQASLDLTVACKAEIEQFFQAVKLERRNDESYDQREAAKEAGAAISGILEKNRAIADAIRERLDALGNAVPESVSEVRREVSIRQKPSH